MSWRCFSLFLCLLFSFPTSFLSSVSSPQDETKFFLKKALLILKEKSVEEQRQRAKHLLESYFDFDAFASLTLLDHWEGLSPEAKQEFLKLFRLRFYENVLSRLEEQTTQKITLKVTGLKLQGQENHVQCQFTKSNKKGEFVLVWVNKSGKWRWVDVEMSTASLIANYQGQFNKIIRDHGFSELLRRLKAKRI